MSLDFVMAESNHAVRAKKREEPVSSEDRILAKTRQDSVRAVIGILLALVFYFFLLLVGGVPQAAPSGGHAVTSAGTAPAAETALPPESETAVKQGLYTPPLWAVLPFVLLLMAIAVLPLIPATAHWWESNRNRFLTAAVLALITLLYYALLHPGGIANHFTHVERSAAGLQTAVAAFSNGIFQEFVPFIVLLFSLYVISGGISLSGDLPAHPATNCAFLGAGALLASFVGTTGAAMVLIRPLLSTNAERKHTVHTVVFFIFIVCNCGGLLLPIGDPPLFLGYLRGVHFTWTLKLLPFWAGVNLTLLAVYFVWDWLAYHREELKDITRDETRIRPLQLRGKINFLFLLGVVLCVAFVIPNRPFPLLGFATPPFIREVLMLLLVAFSLLATPALTRVMNRFDFYAIAEVAALFSGIFICMQVPIEILHIKGAALGVDTPEAFFWATGILSSFLDNAPTYVVFFETATSLTSGTGPHILQLLGHGTISELFLAPISLGAVFMGANTYIGNGPNFMVKSIAEQSGVKMPSFFGYMLYSLLIMGPIYLILTYVFL